MKKLKRISNYLLMIGGILTALSGIVNTSMDIVGSFKKEDKKEIVAPVALSDAEPRARGPKVHAIKTADNLSHVTEAVEQPTTTMSTESLKETKNTIWWVLATIVGSFVASICWYVHGKLRVSVDVSKK